MKLYERVLAPAAIVALLADAPLLRAAEQVFAAPATQLVSSTTSSALKLPLALILVIAMVLVAAWLMRRMNGVAGNAAARMRIVAQLPLGAREKAVLVRIGDQEVLLGVAPGNVRLLLKSDVVASSTETADGAMSTTNASIKDSFREILRRSLGR